MLRSLATIGFIGVCAAAGIHVAMQRTIIKGEVMAANMLEQVRAKGITKVTCDRDIPVTPKGAVFECQFHGSDGSSARFAYTMDRAGALSASLLDSTPPALDRPRGGWDD